MTVPLRVIDTGEMSARWNVAATAALTELHAVGRVGDTLRFHRYPASVLVGRHQVLPRAIHQQKCRTDGVEIARRVTGGGAVYMAPGALAWDVVISRKDLPSRVPDMARQIGASVAAGLSRLGLGAAYRAENEIEIGGRKVCGMSGYRNGDTLVCQGTILVNTDLGDMAEYLRLPSQAARNPVADLAARVVCVQDHLGREPDDGELEAAIACGLSHGLNRDLTYRILSPDERALADELHRTEFEQDAFVYGTNPPGAERGVMIGHDGDVDAYIKIHSGSEKRIDQIWVTGNFTISPSRAILDLEAALRGIPVAAAPDAAMDFLNKSMVEMRGASRFSVAAAIANAQS